MKTNVFLHNYCGVTFYILFFHSMWCGKTERNVCGLITTPDFKWATQKWACLQLRNIQLHFVGVGAQKKAQSCFRVPSSHRYIKHDEDEGKKSNHVITKFELTLCYVDSYQNSDVKNPKYIIEWFFSSPWYVKSVVSEGTFIGFDCAKHQRRHNLNELCCKNSTLSEKIVEQVNHETFKAHSYHLGIIVIIHHHQKISTNINLLRRKKSWHSFFTFLTIFDPKWLHNKGLKLTFSRIKTTNFKMKFSFKAQRNSKLLSKVYIYIFWWSQLAMW